MRQANVSRRYAQALLMVGAEQNALDKYAKELDTFQKRLQRDRDVINAVVSSAVQLNKSDLSELQKRLEKNCGRNVRLKKVIDPRLLGGFVIKAGDTVIDGSVEKRLQRLGQWMRELPEGKNRYDIMPQKVISKGLLEDPGILRQKKRAYLERIIEEERFSPAVANFLRLVLEKNRAGFYEEIISEFKAYADEHRNIVEAEVLSAVGLSEDEISILREKISRYTGKNVRLTIRLDAGVIGGFKVRIGDILIQSGLGENLE